MPASSNEERSSYVTDNKTRKKALICKSSHRCTSFTYFTRPWPNICAQGPTGFADAGSFSEYSRFTDMANYGIGEACRRFLAYSGKISRQGTLFCGFWTAGNRRHLALGSN